MVTLFDAVTLDNWGCNFMITFYGCEKFNNQLYYSKVSMNITDEDWAVIPSMY